MIETNKTYYYWTLTKCPTYGCKVTKIWWLRKDDQIWLKVHQNSHLYCFSFVTNILSALDDQSFKFSKVMSVKSAIFNSLFTTGQKINIAVSRSLYRFYSNIQALAMLSRCSLGIFMISVLRASKAISQMSIPPLVCLPITISVLIVWIKRAWLFVQVAISWNSTPGVILIRDVFVMLWFIIQHMHTFNISSHGHSAAWFICIWRSTCACPFKWICTFNVIVCFHVYNVTMYRQ